MHLRKQFISETELRIIEKPVKAYGPHLEVERIHEIQLGVELLRVQLFEAMRPHVLLDAPRRVFISVISHLLQ